MGLVGDLICLGTLCKLNLSVCWTVGVGVGVLLEKQNRLKCLETFCSVFQPVLQRRVPL